MSIVVAVRKGRRVVLAADTLISFGSQRDATDNVSSTKIMRVGTAYLACTGWALYHNILQDFVKSRTGATLKDEPSIYRFMLKLWRALGTRYALVNTQCGEKDSPFGDLDATFLVINPRGIFRVSSDMSVVAYRKFHAIGSGSDYALGALLNIYDQHRSPRVIAEQAVHTAIHFDVHCGGDVQAVELKGG